MGVIDDNGIQWEKCNSCGEFTKMNLLHYEQPSLLFKYGRDLCNICSKESVTITKKERGIKCQ